MTSSSISDDRRIEYAYGFLVGRALEFADFNATFKVDVKIVRRDGIFTMEPWIPGARVQAIVSSGMLYLELIVIGGFDLWVRQNTVEEVRLCWDAAVSRAILCGVISPHLFVGSF